jgi:phosphoribosylformylglycinamidine synthase
VVVTVEKAALAAVKRCAEEAGVPFWHLGETGGESLRIHDEEGEVLSLSLTEIREARERCLEAIVGT